MAISLADRFAAVDWARAANLSGQISCIACIMISTFAILFNFERTIFMHFGVLIWTLLSGLLIAVWEIPFIYSAIPNCIKLKNTFLDDLYVRLPIVRTIMYTFLALFMLVGGSTTIFVLPGIALFLSAILYAITALNFQQEEKYPFDRSSVGGEGLFSL